MISSTVYRLRLEGLTKIVEPQVASTWFFAVNGLVTLALLPICVQVDDAADTIAWIQHFPPRVFYIAAWSGVAAVGANILFVKAVKALGATRMSIFDLLQRPLVVLFAAAILGESLNWSQAVGFVLVMIGVRYAKVVRIPQAKN